MIVVDSMSRVCFFIPFVLVFSVLRLLPRFRHLFNDLF